jgi:type III pantothenate kinase
MLLAVDIGNTNILFGFFDSNGTILKTFRIETRRARTFDEYYAIYNSLTFDFFQQDGKFDTVEKIIFSSVVSEVNFEFCKFCKHYLKLKPIDISNYKSSIGVSVLIDNPEELGGDRLVNAYSAFKQYGGNNIVIDFGTATTFDIINSKAEYLGGGYCTRYKSIITSLAKLSFQIAEN